MKMSLLAVGCCLVLAGCSAKTEPNQESNTVDNQQGSTQIMAQFDSISAAVRNNEPVKCAISNKETGSAIDYVVKGKKMKMMGSNIGEETQSGNMIFDGEYLYTWTAGNTEGVKMKIPEKTEEDQTGPADTLPDFSQQDTWQEYQKSGFTINCEKTTAQDSEFVPPADVTYTDMSVMMEQLQQKMNQQNQQNSNAEQGIKTMPAPAEE